MDDIVICTTTVEEHTAVLRQVLQRLQNVGRTLNANKCQFCKSEIEFLGHVWSAKGISSSPEKLRALRTMSLPKDKQSLRSFLALAAYLGQGYMGHYSSRIKPLWDTCMLTENCFSWDESRLKSFVYCAGSFVL